MDLFQINLSPIKVVSFRIQERERLFIRKGSLGNRTLHKHAASQNNNIFNHFSHIGEVENKNRRQIPITIAPKVTHFFHEKLAQLQGSTNKIDNGRAKPILILEIEITIANKLKGIFCHHRQKIFNPTPNRGRNMRADESIISTYPDSKKFGQNRIEGGQNPSQLQHSITFYGNHRFQV